MIESWNGSVTVMSCVSCAASVAPPPPSPPPPSSSSSSPHPAATRATSPMQSTPTISLSHERLALSLSRMLPPPLTHSCLLSFGLRAGPVGVRAHDTTHTSAPPPVDEPRLEQRGGAVQHQAEHRQGEQHGEALRDPQLEAELPEQHPHALGGPQELGDARADQRQGDRDLEAGEDRRQRGREQ